MPVASAQIRRGSATSGFQRALSTLRKPSTEFPEREEFEHFLASENERLWWILGGGGTGKSALLAVAGRMLEARGRSWIGVDARDAGDASGALEYAIRTPLDDAVVMLDGFERLGQRRHWVFDEWLPGLPNTTKVVITSRRRMPVCRRLDPGYAALTRTTALGPPEFRETAAPAADARVRRLLQEAPSSVHRLALRASCIPAVTDEAFLAATVDSDESARLLQWLAEQPGFGSVCTGVRPHEAVRASLVREWRRGAPREFARARWATRTAPGVARERIDAPSLPNFRSMFRTLLKEFHHPPSLEKSPLSSCFGSTSADELRRWVVSSCTGLDPTSDNDHEQILQRTFLNRQTTQRQAARELGLSFSTYRRRLEVAIDLATLRAYDSVLSRR